MDSGELVDWQIDAGHKLISRLSRDGFEVAAAFWAWTAEEGAWFLYVASPLVERSGSAEAYRHLFASLRKLEGTPLSFSDVKLIGSENPIAEDVAKLLAESRPAGRIGFRFEGRQLGGMTLDQAYIYSNRSFDPDEERRARTEEILRDLLGTMSREAGTHGPKAVMLKDGTTFLGYVTDLHWNRDGVGSAEFLESGKAGEEGRRTVDLGEIAAVG